MANRPLSLSETLSFTGSVLFRIFLFSNVDLINQGSTNPDGDQLASIHSVELVIRYENKPRSYSLAIFSRAKGSYMGRNVYILRNNTGHFV